MPGSSPEPDWPKDGWSATLALRGAGGEPVDLRRTVVSHGLTELPPMRVHPDESGFDVVLRMPSGRPLRVRVRPAGGGGGGGGGPGGGGGGAAPPPPAPA